MTNKPLHWLSLLFFTCAPLASTFGAELPLSEAYDSKTIENIEVTVENPPPNFSFDPKKVIGRLKTKTGDPFSQTTFDSDLKALSDDYDRVESAIDVQNGRVYVHIKLWLRPVIRAIRWKGNSIIKTKTLQKELGIKPHSTFNRPAFNKAFNKLKEYYIKKGYFESQLQYTLFPDAKTNEVDVEIDIKEGRSGKIDNIVFKGFTSSERSDILEMIYTKKYNLFTSWIFGTGIYNEEALDQDKLTIVNLLQNRGYADAKVTINIREAKTAGKIIIEIITERGPIFHFGQVTFDGNTLFTDEEIEKTFIIHPGEVYSPEKMRNTAQAVKDLYGRKGYIEANVQYDAQLVEDEPTYNVHFEIEEGQEYKIGLIRIFGNVQTQAGVILHESLLIPGETFDSAKLKATQARLENIGYFKSVNVYAVRTQDDQSLGENYRDVFIEVQETTTGNVSLFAGFSSADNVFGGLDLAESNFNYKGLFSIFKKGLSAMRGGGEYAHARFNVGAKQRTYSVSWMTPYFRDTLWRVGFNGEIVHSHLQAEDYNTNTIGLTLYANYPLTPYWTFGCKYRIRNAQIHVAQDTGPVERRQAKNSGILSAVGTSLSYDSTDSAVKPHRGLRSALEADFTGVGGDFSFFRLGYVSTYYQSLWSRGVMKYRWEFRFIQPMLMSPTPNDIPLSERFFLGGENSVRGYKPFDLGQHFGSGDPTGGISSSLLSVEYLQEVFRFLDAFVFADAGSVSLHRFTIPKYNMSYGFGVRLELINRVPVILGLGFPVNPDSNDQVRKFFFSMGGQF